MNAFYPLTGHVPTQQDNLSQHAIFLSSPRAALVFHHFVLIDLCLKLNHAALTATQIHQRKKRTEHPSRTYTHSKYINSTKPDFKLTRWYDVKKGLVGMLGDWQARLLSAPPGRHQWAAALLLSELCSGPLCHTYICTWPSTIKCKWGWTHIRACIDTCVHTHMNTHTHSLCPSALPQLSKAS